LIAWPQWMIWRYLQRSDRPKPDKVPHNTMGYKCDYTNPQNWSTFENVLRAAARPGFCDGIGFVFAEDPFCGIDLDCVWLSDADEGAPWARGILERFADTYSEVSPSGSGVKIWCRAKAPRCGKWPIGRGAIEVYDRRRFFVMTGQHRGILAITDHQADVEALVANLDQSRLDEDRRENRRTSQAPLEAVLRRPHRHRTLVSLAGTMWRRGMHRDAIEAALLEVNRRQCDPPYAPRHVHQIIESMQRWHR
jgi:primase-polymerase (primpol)-like protein